MYPPDENPYASPKYAPPVYPTDQPVSHFFVDGKILVVDKQAVFPDRCVKCNAPAYGYRLKRKLYWHSGWIYLLIFICNIIVYAIVAIIVQQSATFHIGLCDVHRKKRHMAIATGWASFVGAIALLVAAVHFESVMLGIGAILLFLGGIIYSIVGTRVITPKCIDKSFAWLRGTGQEFRDSLTKTIK